MRPPRSSDRGLVVTTSEAASQTGSIEIPSTILAANVPLPSPLLGRGFLAGGEGESTIDLSLPSSPFPQGGVEKSAGLDRRQFIAASAALALAGLPSLVRAVDAPPTAPAAAPSTAWPSFRNGNQLRGIATSSLPTKLEVLWKESVQDGITATAAIVGVHVFAATLGGELICYERLTGKRVWTYFSAPRKKPDDFIAGFQSSPTVTRELVLVGDEDGRMHAVDRASGKPRWKFETGAEIIASAAVVGERVIFGSYDSTLYCVKLADGEEVWKFKTQDRINGSPAIAGNLTFVTGCDQHLRAINIETGQEKFDLPLERFMIASPAVFDSMLYVGTHEGEFLAIDITKPEVTWRYSEPGKEQPYHSSAALTEERVIVGCQDKLLHCFDRKTGKQQWAFAANGQINSSPVLVGGDRLFVGSNDGHLYEIGIADGKQRWKQKLGRSIAASPAVGEGCLVIGAEGTEGAIYCLGAKVA